MNSNLLLGALSLSIGLLGCVAAPPTSGAGPGATTTTEWKEGYGGDSIALEALRIIETTCFQSRKLRPYLIRRALETEKSIADSVCGLLNASELIIESVAQPMVGGVAKDAANYPEARPRRIEIKKDWWTAATTTVEQKEKLILHEILPLIGLGDKDYVRSSRLQVALLALRGQSLSEVSCDRGRLYSHLAGAQPPLGRWLGRELGIQKCRTTVDILSDTATNGTFEDSMQVDLVHSYIVGLIYGVTRTMNIRTIKEFETGIIDALVRLPDSLSFWSPALCQLTSLAPPVQSCGNVIEFLVGARPHQRSLAIGEHGSQIDFIRASYSVLLKIRESTEKALADALVENGSVDPVLIEAAIRSHNWVHLAYLGQIQRELYPNRIPSGDLLPLLDWSKIKSDESFKDLINYNEPNGRPCLVDDIRQQAIAIFNGKALQFRCTDSFTI